MLACSLDRASHLDRLGDEIAELAAHLDAATARLLELIREFDAREGWGTGFSSCAAWLSWRVGLEPGAARERVRVARALGALPRIARALARGGVSYSKVRAITRVATPPCASSFTPSTAWPPIAAPSSPGSSQKAPVREETTRPSSRYLSAGDDAP